MTETPNELDQESFNSLISSTQKLVIVQFYTPTCPNCKAIEPVFRELAGELSKEAVFGKLNAAHYGVVAARYGIRGVPTFKFFCKGRPIWEVVGAVNETIFRNTIKDILRYRSECVTRSSPLTFELTGYG